MANRSPFPGMDPYLEQHWGDVHAKLVTYICDQIQQRLPDDLLARTEERVIVRAEYIARYAMYPDVRVVQHSDTSAGGVVAIAESDVAVAEPILFRLESEPATETFVEIRDAGSGNRVVTVIEILSPSNKSPGDTQEQYLKKQRELKQGNVNLVEIDLLRAGNHIVSLPANRVPNKIRSNYQICVRRGANQNETEYYPVSLRERLPIFRIPLRDSDNDVLLDLQAAIDLVYKNGRYHIIDYQVEPVPPLRQEDAQWADEMLRKAERRQS